MTLLFILTNPEIFSTILLVGACAVIVWVLTKYTHNHKNKFYNYADKVAAHIEHDPVDLVSFQVIEVMIIKLYDLSFDRESMHKAHDISNKFKEVFKEFYDKVKVEE